MSGERLVDRILAMTGKVPRRGSKLDMSRTARGVGRSAEFVRIQHLPQRVLDLAAVPDLSAIWRIDDHGCPGCELCRDRDGRKITPTLRPVQSAMLLEADLAGGLFAQVGVGGGKELATLLLADALGLERALIVTKARLKAQMLERDIPRYSRHFRLPLDRVAAVATYNDLSDKDRGQILERDDFDGYVFNEAHALRGRQSACGRKHVESVRRFPTARRAYLSGTMSNDSILDYQHLIEAALRSGSPLPTGWRETQEWSRALDVPSGRPDDPGPIRPGVLLHLCGPDVRDEELGRLDADTAQAVAAGAADPRASDPAREVARAIYRRRLVATRGVVVAASETDCDASLVVEARRPEIPVEVAAALRDLRRLWRLDGADLSDAKDVAEVARQMSSGFYYVWVWPDGVVDEEWCDAKSSWARAARHKVKYSRTYHSPEMVSSAVERGEIPAGDEAAAAWREWQRVRGRHSPHPPVEPRWLSRFLVDDALGWAGGVRADQPGIVWYRYRAVGQALAAAGLKVYGEGDEGDAILGSTDRVCAASLVHRDGKNLQRFCRAYVLNPPANATDWEQLLGREHRPGQRAHEVRYEVAAHDRILVRSVAKAIREARSELAGQGRQKLLLAARLGFGPDIDQAGAAGYDGPEEDAWSGE